MCEHESQLGNLVVNWQKRSNKCTNKTPVWLAELVGKMAKHLFVRQQCEDGADDGAVDKGEGGEVVDDEVSDWQLRTQLARVHPC